MAAQQQTIAHAGSDALELLAGSIRSLGAGAGEGRRPREKSPTLAKVLDKHAVWRAIFSQRLSAYETLIDAHRAKLEAFEAAKLDELEKLKARLAAEIRQTDQALLEVAPIARGDIDAIPSRRAAYSDRTAALLAKMAMLAYIDFEDDEKRKILEGMLEHGRVKLVETIAIGETEAMVAETDKFVVVAFRGTASRSDIRTDIQARLNVARVAVDGRPVRVHSGFYCAFRKVEARLRDLLLAQDPAKAIYLTGHSLGGALALVAAAAFGGNDRLGDRIAAVYTYGAPRVGGRDFPDIVKAPHYRVVNSGDVVPLVPPNWLTGYVHTGTPILLKENADRPIRRSPWSSALLLALQSLILWPFLHQLRLRKAHDSYLYIARLDRIADRRGKWT
ncbi:MAG TPA: lipase family protein [Hyphomicrobiaceae bacterium]|nr:lipase family protein [Hyphomicrobiaceae bacterium]